MSRAIDPEIIDALSRVTTFDKSTIEHLAAVGRPINIPQGWTVIVENTPADKAYIILSGAVEIRRDGVSVATLTAGDVVGEMALVNGRLRNATVVAVAPLRALHLTDDDVASLIKLDPEFGQRLEAAATDRLG